MDLWQILFIAIVAGGVALAIKAAFERDKPRPPDVPGDCTPEQIERWTQLKYRYETEVNR